MSTCPGKKILPTSVLNDAVSVSSGPGNMYVQLFLNPNRCCCKQNSITCTGRNSRTYVDDSEPNCWCARRRQRHLGRTGCIRRATVI